MHDAFWSDYNIFDKEAERIEADRIEIIRYQAKNVTHISKQLRVVYDDEWCAIRKPTNYPTKNPTTMQPTSSPSNFPSSSPTKKPTTKGSAKRQQKSAKSDEQILSEYQKKSNMASKNAQHHIVKLFSLYSSYSDNAVTDFESHLLRDKHCYDKILIEKSLPSHPSSDKMTTSFTKIDLLFDYVYQFIKILKNAPIDHSDLYECLGGAVVFYKYANNSKATSIFFDIHSALQSEYCNHSNAMQLAHDIMVLYEGGLDAAAKDPEYGMGQIEPIENVTMCFIFDFFIKSFEQISELKLNELHLIWNQPIFPYATKAFIEEKMNVSTTIAAQIKSKFNLLKNQSMRLPKNTLNY